MQKPKRGSNVPKVFLGGLPPNVTETDLRQFFDRYGKVVEVVIMYDQERRRTRGKLFSVISPSTKLIILIIRNAHLNTLH